MSEYRQHPWLVHLAWKLLQADPGALSLLAEDPFDGEPPRFVRATRYRYEFSEPGDPGGAWWKRRALGSYLPILDANNESLRRYLAQYGWGAP